MNPEARLRFTYLDTVLDNNMLIILIGDVGVTTAIRLCDHYKKRYGKDCESYSIIIHSIPSFFTTSTRRLKNVMLKLSEEGEKAKELRFLCFC